MTASVSLAMAFSSVQALRYIPEHPASCIISITITLQPIEHGSQFSLLENSKVPGSIESIQSIITEHVLFLGII